MICVQASGANFADSYLTGAHPDTGATTGDNFTGAIWNDTTCPDGTRSNDYLPQTCVGHGI